MMYIESNLPHGLIGLLATISTFSPNAAAQPQQLLRQQRQAVIEVAATSTMNDIDNNNMMVFSNINNDDPPLLEEMTESLIAMQFTEDPHAGRDHMEMILNGELGLSSIRFAPTSFDDADDGEGRYANVHGEFCDFDATLNKEDPSDYPTIDRIMSMSNHCDEHRYMINLDAVMDAVRERDASQSSTDSGDGVMKMKQLPVAGLLFHEGYAGAGLISNALTTFDSVHVISEHTALRDALSACDVVKNRFHNPNCSPAARDGLVRDVIALLSRVPADSDLEHLYLKLSSASSAYIPELRALYPSAKWAFVFRGAEHALAKATLRRRKTDCLKRKRNPSAALAAKSVENGIDLESLSHHETCALHLSALLDVAFKEHEASKTGKLISYDDELLQNVDGMTNTILPYFGVGEEIAADPEGVKSRVAEVLAMRSNAADRVNPDHKKWIVEDIEVSEEVREASRMYLNDSTSNIGRVRQ
jgi:hypothetical protein